MKSNLDMLSSQSASTVTEAIQKGKRRKDKELSYLWRSSRHKPKIFPMPNLSIGETPTWGIHIWVEGLEFAAAIQGSLSFPEPEQEQEKEKAKFDPNYKVMDVIGIINVNKDECWSGEDPGTGVGSHSQSGLVAEERNRRENQQRTNLASEGVGDVLGGPPTKNRDWKMGDLCNFPRKFSTPTKGERELEEASEVVWEDVDGYPTYQGDSYNYVKTKYINIIQQFHKFI